MHPNWKGRSKIVTICRWHDTIYRKPTILHQKALELINEFSTIAQYKINIQKSVAFLYAKNELPESKKQSHLKSHQKE